MSTTLRYRQSIRSKNSKYIIEKKTSYIQYRDENGNIRYKVVRTYSKRNKEDVSDNKENK